MIATIRVWLPGSHFSADGQLTVQHLGQLPVRAAAVIKQFAAGMGVSPFAVEWNVSTC
ncbi:MAG: hypothetical protein JO251_00225 [Verrucomicrobia bacterium]|nr:hypothetical protein [Verrucomicrobiota bacterium]